MELAVATHTSVSLCRDTGTAGPLVDHIYEHEISKKTRQCKSKEGTVNHCYITTWNRFTPTSLKLNITQISDGRLEWLPVSVVI